jgi:hypothetical protein
MLNLLMKISCGGQKNNIASKQPLTHIENFVLKTSNMTRMLNKTCVEEGIPLP